MLQKNRERQKGICEMYNKMKIQISGKSGEML